MKDLFYKKLQVKQEIEISSQKTRTLTQKTQTNYKITYDLDLCNKIFKANLESLIGISRENVKLIAEKNEAFDKLTGLISHNLVKEIKEKYPDEGKQ